MHSAHVVSNGRMILNELESICKETMLAYRRFPGGNEENRWEKSLPVEIRTG
jgi:hypothetical protein